MGETPSPFCPETCLFRKDKQGFVHEDCHHLKDRKFEQPIPAEMIWYANVWISVLIIGENQDEYIVENPQTGIIQVKKDSPLLK